LHLDAAKIDCGHEPTIANRDAGGYQIQFTG
jgi:hypothetical protein